jgi:ATP-binding cassette subfamily B protein
MLQQLTLLLRAGTSLVAMLAVLATFRPLLALAVALLALPQVLIQFRHQRQNWSVQSREIPEVRAMDYLRSTLTSSADAKEIRIFGLADFFLRRYLQKFEEFRHRHAGLQTAQWRADTALSALAAVASTSAYAYVVLQALAGRITVGSLTLYASAINQVQAALAEVVTQLAGLYESNLFITHLFEFLDLPPTMRPLPPPRARPVPVSLREGIELRRVAFRYPGTERLVLEDVSFTIRPGEAVALVGENGAGKTTLVKLLCRLYDPTEGQILVDGVDLREYDLDQWRSQIGAIFQDYSRYHLTASENVGVGRVARVDDLTAVQAAAARSGADSVIARLSEGYDTTLGRRLWSMTINTRTLRISEGVDLSGGEWQKIALARAFMRADSPAGNGHAGGLPTEGAQLLILDEPTAALDAQAEYDVYRHFHELTRGRATLLISHRFSTVRMADQIVMIEQGRVAERGPHDELVARGGRYAALYEMQAGRYR